MKEIVSLQDFSNTAIGNMPKGKRTSVDDYLADHLVELGLVEVVESKKVETKVDNKMVDTKVVNKKVKAKK